MPMLKIICSGKKRVRYRSSGLADGQSLSTSLNEKRVKAGERAVSLPLAPAGAGETVESV